MPTKKPPLWTFEDFQKLYFKKQDLEAERYKLEQEIYRLRQKSAKVASTITELEINIDEQMRRLRK